MINGQIARWTTPSVIFKPAASEVADISAAALTIRQFGQTVMQRSLSDAQVVDNGLLWDFSQADTSQLISAAPLFVQIDYITKSGTRYTTVPVEYSVLNSAVEGVLQ